ncbi:hypothetical protein BGS_0684 [Beggiatoa sp. SS]|nr:hypothetical protein BGS_0684 [Beggiatoa sp. SS]
MQPETALSSVQKKEINLNNQKSFIISNACRYELSLLTIK